MMSSADITVAMIHPPTWENDGEVFPITDPLPVEEWLPKVSGRGWELETLPDDSLIAGGPYNGGHVIMVHNQEEDNTFLFAVPPVAIPLLGGLLPDDQYHGLLPDDQYHRLLQRTPSLAEVAARQIIGC